ncbi:potassium channel family protein [Lysinibacillus fusiformis]|uniref:potassium channel family protein n=1 Tax=Lysinibacillus fusiformis TaxID=28031 RepID=UPI0021C196C7|nr:potassium channel family protein [Lysinibacillus fusiformis]UXJ70803.1 potassium channel family protein [Lysinibacillus fusiformis]
MEKYIFKFFKKLWFFIINRFRIPYIEFVMIIYYSLVLFNDVAIPEKYLLKLVVAYLAGFTGFLILLDCIISLYKYMTIEHKGTDKKLVIKKIVLKIVLLIFPLIIRFIEKVLSQIIIPSEGISNLSQLGLLYVLLVLISSLVFISLIVRYSMISGFWKNGWVSLIFASYIFIAYSFSLIYYIGDYYSVSKGEGFSFSEKIENEILVRNALNNFDKELVGFQEGYLETVIKEKQNKIGYTVIDVEGNELNLTTEKIGEGWAGYFYDDLIKSYNLFSILDITDFKFSNNSFIESYSKVNYNIFINGNYKLLKIGLYNIPNNELNGSIIKDKYSGLGIERYLKREIYLVISEENFTNYSVLELQSKNYILLNKLLAFSNVLLDDSIVQINQIITEGKSISFIDYLYYSFVVITTLGFGDITPISKLFRFLTVLEALLGLITMGLFLAKVFDSKK